MMKIICLIILLFIFGSTDSLSSGTINQNEKQKNSVVHLKNDSLTVSVDLWGGAIVNLALTGNKINPLDWNVSQNEMPENNRNGAPFQGHFLCFGRWGGPTEGEIKAGIPHNGEPANHIWQQTKASAEEIKMEVTAPLENWSVNRTVRLSENQACFVVEESFTNPEHFGRFTTIVQHATFGGDFLDNTTIVNSNAGAGFNQALIANSLSEFAYKWPEGYADSLRNPIDFRNSDQNNGYVTTHIINDSIGWATIASPHKKLLVGYVWKTKDYPWLHVWHGMKNETLWAKGIEFGTTGLGDTFTPEERMKTSFHRRYNYFFVDAGSVIEKSYACFLLPVDATFLKTKAINYFDNKIEVTAQSETGETKHLFRAKF